MHKVFTPTIVIVILSSIHCQQPVLQYTNQLRKAVPHHWENDQEKFGRRVDQIERGHQVRVGARGEHPLRPHHKIPWLRWVQEGRFAKQAHKDPEIQRIRTRLLEEKLKPNHLVFKPHINPQLKPKLKSRENVRTKRDIAEVNFENKQKQSEQQIQQNVRLKREAMMSPQLLPEMVMQPHIEAAIPQPAEQEYQGRIKESEKRDKRELFYFINPPPQLLARIPRTTPNPFIRETNIEDYDIIKPDDGERTGVVSNRDSSYTDLKSYPLMSFQKVLSYLTKSLLNLKIFTKMQNQEEIIPLWSLLETKFRIKRSPKMSKLKKRQKVEKKKRKKKKQKEPSPRQIKHFRRIREKKEKRRRILHKKLKEKQRLRHKKLGTGPYNKTIIDYHGIYFDPPSIQLNESLYDSIYDTSEIDSDAFYEEKIKNYPEPEDSEESDDKEYQSSKGISDDRRDNSDTEDGGVKDPENKLTIDKNQDNSNQKSEA